MVITIKSAFGRGGRLLEWEGGGFREIRHVHSCTWQGDADDSASISVPDNFRGAVVRWYMDGHTRIPRAKLIGFGADELAGPAPVEGWGYCRIGYDAAEWSRLATIGQYLRALAEHGPAGVLAESEVLASARHYGGGTAVGELSYEWGCQPTGHYVLFEGGKYAREEKGCGDNTPYFTDTGEIRYPQEDRDDFLSACEAITRRLEREQGAWLRASYARSQNPLPRLRKSPGGRWEYRRLGAGGNYPAEPHGELVLPNGDSVIWTPPAN